MEESLKSTYNLQVSFNAVDGTPSAMYFQFTQEQERSRWYTYLTFLKERLQY